jgi:hypothetical protein
MIQRAIPVLHITNAGASEAFYRGLLGLQREFQFQPVNEPRSLLSGTIALRMPAMACWSSS